MNILFVGVTTLVSILAIAKGCDECNQCWNYKRCEVKSCPWTARRYYSVMVSQVKTNNFWGNGDSCGVFNQCSKSGCGCLTWDVYQVKGDYIEGAFTAYDRKNKVQYLRKFSGKMSNNWGDVTLFIHSSVTWTVPPKVVEKVTCDECGKKKVEKYTVPGKSVQKQVVSVKVRTILLVVEDKYRVLVFCDGLKGISENKPFALVLATMPMPSQETWKKINASLREYKFEPREMVFLRHEKCIYPPFDYCKSLKVPKNKDCDICQSQEK